jgi:ATP-dependent Clp protease ATP-binding subunit ClpC
MKSRVTGELKKVFRPELLNRIDEVIVFHKLGKPEIKQIIDLMLKRLREQMAVHKVTIELTDGAKDLLVDKGFDPSMGARPLRRAIQRLIEDPLADFVLGAELMSGATLIVDRKGESEEVDIQIIPGPEPEPEPEAKPKPEKVAVASDSAPADEEPDESPSEK